MIIFELLLTTFKYRLFIAAAGAVLKNKLEPKIKPL